jgi:2',3'-cyclic-nucleotide 2'-phosphodiesterase/3'-nucleotidase
MPARFPRPRLLLSVTVLVLGACATPSPRTQAPVEGMRARLALLETTDIHSNVLSYDYFKLAADPDLGLERASELIRAARAEFENTLTFDSGDTIQGTALADWQALVAPVPCDAELAVYKAMDAIGYDAATIGNHDFNYGLPFLSRVTATPFSIRGVPATRCRGPKFPFVLSNVFDAADGKPLFAPWRILTRTLHAHAADGSTRDVRLRIGVVGFTPTQIIDWDKRNLEGKVTVMGVVEAAQKYVPEVRAAGADLVVALIHGGIDTRPYGPDTENAGWHLAGVPGVDAILLGHSHQVFPSPGDAKARYAHLPEVDNERGFLRGVPAVMGNYYAKNIGVIDLALAYAQGRWQVDRADTHAEVRAVKRPDGTYAAVDPAIAPLVEHEHEATIAYVKTPIGTSDYEMSTYFVAVGDTSAIGIVNAAERAYVERYIREKLPQLAGVPVLAAASPFKAGFGGPADYTDVKPGPLAINTAADLYLYPNTVTAVKTTGAGVRAWLEKSAQAFNRIDPARREPQELLNTRVPTYNFDILQGELTYAIDVTAEAGRRIRDLRFRGAPIVDDQAFIVVTNNYRGNGGGSFPGMDGSNIVVSAPDTNRDALIEFVRETREITRARFGGERSWRFAPAHVAGPVTFKSAAGKLELARQAGLDNVALLEDKGDGTAIYTVDLSH